MKLSTSSKNALSVISNSLMRNNIANALSKLKLEFRESEIDLGDYNTEFYFHIKTEKKRRPQILILANLEEGIFITKTDSSFKTEKPLIYAIKKEIENKEYQVTIDEQITL